MTGSVVLVALCIVFTGHIPSSYTRTTETTPWTTDVIFVTDRDQISRTDQTTDTTQVTEEEATTSSTDQTSTEVPAYNASSTEGTTDTTQVTEEEGTASTVQPSAEFFTTSSRTVRTPDSTRVTEEEATTYWTDQTSTEVPAYNASSTERTTDTAQVTEDEITASSSSTKQTTDTTRVTEEEGTSWTVQTSADLPTSSSITIGTPDTTRVTEEIVTTTSQHTTAYTVDFSQSSKPVTTEQETMISADHSKNIGLYIGLSLGSSAVVGSLIMTLIFYRQRRLCFKIVSGDRMMRNQPELPDIVSPNTSIYQPNLQIFHIPTEMSVYENRSADTAQHEEASEYYNEYPLSSTGAHTYMNLHIDSSFQADAADYGGPYGPYDLPDNVRYEGINDSEHLYLSIANQTNI